LFDDNNVNKELANSRFYVCRRGTFRDEFCLVQNIRISICSDSHHCMYTATNWIGPVKKLSQHKNDDLVTNIYILNSKNIFIYTNY